MHNPSFRMFLPPLKFTALIAFLLAGACTVGPDYRRPSVVVPSRYKEMENWKEAQPNDHALPGKWWEIFKDANLNRLENQVDAGNLSIAQAEAQYRQAQAMVQGATAAYFPTVNGTATVNRFRAAQGQNQVVSGVRYLFGAAVSAAWEPDLWGTVRRQVESSQATAQASAGTLQGMRLSMQASLAQNYFQLRTLDTQIKLLGETVAAYEKALKIIQNRYLAGVSAKADVVQAETQLESTRAQALHLGIQRAQLEHAIAVLMGKRPVELTIPVDVALTSPPAVPVSLPSRLLERRPDIATAERQAAAANAQIGVAKAAYFPKISLSATNGVQSNTLANLLSAGARYWALGPAALALPLFDGGARGADLQESIAAYDANVAAYRQTVLTGFQEVEDNLAALRILEREMAVQAGVVATAKKSVQLTMNQYKAGVVSFLDVTVVQAAALTNENAQIVLQGQQLVASVLLIKALGGGWHEGKLPSMEEAGGKAEWSQFLPVPVK